MPLFRYTHLNNYPAERDVFRVDVTDGFNRLINQKFNILITPEDNIMPNVVNKELYVKENSDMIITTDTLSATDLNSPDEDLQFIITKTPLKGHLESLDNEGVPITQFTQLDLAAGKIIYKHTSIDEVKIDNFEFEVNDGRNKVFRTFRIKLNSDNNKIPVVRKKVVKVNQGQKTVITPFDLTVTDNDTEFSSLIFKIEKYPQFGKILLDGEKQILTFSMNDINRNRITYAHNGAEIRTDSLTLSLTDGKHKEYFEYPEVEETKTSPIQLLFKIKKVDKNAPILAINRGTTSLQQWDGLTIFRFKPSRLLAIDSGTLDENLIRFSLRKHPSHGRIVRSNNVDKRISKFSQQNINKKEVLYIFSGDKSVSSDSMIFDIYDMKKNMLRGQTFSFNWAWISVAQIMYKINESDRFATLTFKRDGYLQTTSFATIKVENGSAYENKDFTLEGRNIIQFDVGETKTTLTIKIMNNNRFEKEKRFIVKLTNPIQGVISDRGNATVVIKDAEDGRK